MILFVWTCRIVGWSATLAFTVYIAVNYNGISVRGQIARLTMPLESLEATKTLLNRYGHAPTNHAIANLRARQFCNPGPWYTLRPSPTAVVVEEYHLKLGLFVLVFDRDGHRVGNPIILPELPDFSCYVSWVEVVAHGEAHFLLAQESCVSSPANLSFTFRTMQMDGHDTREVFLLTFDRPPNGWFSMSIETDDGILRLQLNRMMFFQPVSSSQTAAEFEWDETQGRFVGPPEDPGGLWQVLRWGPNERPSEPEAL